MKLTKGFEQAICVMALLTTQLDDVPVSAHVINTRLEGSHAYMRKLMRKLVVADLVSSVPGNSGGFMLAKHPADISVLDVIEAVEGDVITYPNSNLLTKVFKDKELMASQGEEVIKQIFGNADNLWKNYLRSQTVMEVVQQTFGTTQIEKFDWNIEHVEDEKKRHTLIGKVLKK